MKLKINYLFLFIPLFCLNTLIINAQIPNYWKSGNEKYKAMDYSGAIDDYTKVIEQNPENAEAYFARGRAKFDIKACECGTDDFDRAISIDKDYADAYAARAIVYNCSNDTAMAGMDVRKALSIDPKNALAYTALGYSHIMQEDYNRALDDISIAKKLKPAMSKTLLYYKGIAYLGMNKYDMAIKNFNKSLKIDPTQKDIYLSRAEALLNKGRRQKAIMDYDTYLKLDPDNQAVHFTKGLVLIDMHDYKAAIAEFNKDIEMNPNHTDYYFARGLAYGKMDDFASAVVDLKKADDMPKENNAFIDSAGAPVVPYFGTRTANSCKSCKMTESNMKYYNSVIALDQEYKSEAYFMKCVSMRKTGNEAGACEDCARAKENGYKNARWYTPKVCRLPGTAAKAK